MQMPYRDRDHQSPCPDRRQTSALCEPEPFLRLRTQGELQGPGGLVANGCARAPSPLTPILVDRENAAPRTHGLQLWLPATADCQAAHRNRRDVARILPGMRRGNEMPSNRLAFLAH